MRRVLPSRNRWSRPRTTLCAAAVAGVVAVGLAACGSSSPSSTSSTGSSTSGTIVWSASPIVGVGANDVRNVLIKAFEKAYPKIHVTLVSASTETDTNRATLATEISGGSATPDVFMGDVIWPAQFGAHQLAVPLSKYLPASYFAKFAPGLIQGATYKGQVYGSPLFEDQGFLYYRKDLLAKYHLAVPTTWEQLESDAKEVQAKAGIKYGFVWEGDSYEGLTCDFMEYLTDAGGTVTNSGYSKATLDTPAALKAATFMRSLITSGVTPASVTTFQEPQAMDIFAAGQSVFLRNWDYAYSYATTPATSKLTTSQVGVAPLPTFQGMSYPGYSNIGGWNMYINPHSKHIGVDLTFIKWLSSQQAQDILAVKYSEIPTVESVRTSAAVVAANPVLAIVGKTRLVPRPAGTPNYPALSTAIYTNVNAILAGSVSPSAGLANAQSQASAALTSTASGGL
ncbi:MAG TPA: ABC transporter substrate-binding protein [Streptosporangiaceae bacterium]|nr:ABC transporter substrate-binding protein [Streptosporangiaceae bacterium]